MDVAPSAGFVVVTAATVAVVVLPVAGDGVIEVETASAMRKTSPQSFANDLPATAVFTNTGSCRFHKPVTVGTAQQPSSKGFSQVHNKSASCFAKAEGFPVKVRAEAFSNKSSSEIPKCKSTRSFKSL